MPVTNFPDGLNIGSSAGATAVFQLGTTEVAVTAAELNAIHNAAGISATEFDVLDGATAGTVVADKALVVGAFKDIDTIDISTASGIKVQGVAITSTPAELNYLDTSTPGTAVASKALVLGAAKDVDVIDFASAGTPFKIAGSNVTTSAAELNTLEGVLGAKVLSYDSATAMVAASGSTAITGAGTVSTGLGATVQQVIASLANIGTAAGEANVVFANPTVGGGSVIFSCFDIGGTVATSAGTVNWAAFGTAAS